MIFFFLFVFVKLQDYCELGDIGEGQSYEQRIPPETSSSSCPEVNVAHFYTEEINAEDTVEFSIFINEIGGQTSGDTDYCSDNLYNIKAILEIFLDNSWERGSNYSQYEIEAKGGSGEATTVTTSPLISSGHTYHAKLTVDDLSEQYVCYANLYLSYTIESYGGGGTIGGLSQQTLIIIICAAASVILSAVVCFILLIVSLGIYSCSHSNKE